METLSNYRVLNDKIYVTSEFAESIIIQSRQLGGKWIAEKKAWEFTLSRLDAIKEKIGDINSKKCVVRVNKQQLEKGQAYTIGWYVLASRRGRDNAASLFCDLVAGTLPSFGGSMKNPAVAASDDAEFEFCCYLDFAQKHNLNIIKIEELESTTKKADLLNKKQTLLDELQKIEIELNQLTEE